MSTPCYPTLYQINTRVWLTELSGQLGRRRPWMIFRTSNWTELRDWVLTGSGF